MQNFKQAFIEFALQYQVLRFGEFTLKSGRISPYFFNAGIFNDGSALGNLGQFYAATIKESQLSFDILYGPAYKGIPLAVTTAIALSTQYQLNKPYCFNRKEVKDHGEGGHLVGAKLTGKALIVDDVITAGTAIRESVTVLEQAGAALAGVVIALDRQELAPESQYSAVQEVERRYQVPVLSIIKLDDIIQYIGNRDQTSEYSRYLDEVLNYRDKYGI